MAKYRLKIEATVDANTEAEAMGAARVLETLLKNPMVATLARGQGINLVAIQVDPKPSRVG